MAGVDAYRDSRLAKITRAKVERREFARQLKIIHTGLRNAMLRVFIRINASLTDDQWEDLRLDDIKGSKFFDVWIDVLNTNHDAIKTKFESTIEDIKFVIDDMVDVLSKVMKETDIAADPGPELLRRVIQNDKEDKTFSTPKNFIKGFKFARSGYKRSKLSERMERNVAQLDRLNETQDLIEKLAPPSGSMRESLKSHGPFLDRVRGYSNHLYDALNQIWRCECHKSPSAMLRLEKRKTPKPNETHPLCSR
jgi:hypothetical protein